MKEEKINIILKRIIATFLSVYATTLFKNVWIEANDILSSTSETLTASDFCMRISDPDMVNELLYEYLPGIFCILHAVLYYCFIFITIFNIIFIFIGNKLSEERKAQFTSFSRGIISVAAVSIAYIVIFYISIYTYESEINKGFTTPIIDFTLMLSPIMLLLTSIGLIINEKSQVLITRSSTTVTTTTSTITSPPTIHSRFCTNCGTAIPSGSSFCPACGRAVETVTAPAPGSASPEVLARIEEEEKRRKEAARIENTLKSGGWKCTCGRVNPSYTGTCACGNTKYK